MTARMEGSTLTVRKVLRLSCESLSLFEVDGLCPLIARLCCDCNNFIRIQRFYYELDGRGDELFLSMVTLK